MKEENKLHAVIFLKFKNIGEADKTLHEIKNFIKKEKLKEPRLFLRLGWFDASISFNASNVGEIMDVVKKIRSKKNVAILETSTIVGEEIDLNG